MLIQFLSRKINIVDSNVIELRDEIHDFPAKSTFPIRLKILGDNERAPTRGSSIFEDEMAVSRCRSFVPSRFTVQRDVTAYCISLIGAGCRFLVQPSSISGMRMPRFSTTASDNGQRQRRRRPSPRRSTLHPG